MLTGNKIKTTISQPQSSTIDTDLLAGAWGANTTPQRQILP